MAVVHALRMAVVHVMVAMHALRVVVHALRMAVVRAITKLGVHAIRMAVHASGWRWYAIKISLKDSPVPNCKSEKWYHFE